MERSKYFLKGAFSGVLKGLASKTLGHALFSAPTFRMVGSENSQLFFMLFYDVRRQTCNGLKFEFIQNAVDLPLLNEVCIMHSTLQSINI